MSFFRKILEKPWLPQDDAVIEFSTSYFAVHNRKVALVLFLCIVGILFFLLFSAYYMRLGMGTDWVSTPEPPLLWLNTVVLIGVSLVFEWCRSAVGQQQIRPGKIRFLFAGSLTVLFLVLQLVVWNQLLDIGYAAKANPANAFFYMITAIHGIHLLGGLIAWVRTYRKFMNEADAVKLKLGVDLCALYWHFLLFVWIVMLALFIST